MYIAAFVVGAGVALALIGCGAEKLRRLNAGKADGASSVTRERER